MRILAPTLLLLLAVQLELSRSACAFDHFKMLDVQVHGQRLTGRVLKRDDRSCVFLGRDGRLQQFENKQVTDFSELSGWFKPLSHAEMKDQLLAEFGKKFEVHASTHFVIVARVGMAEQHAAIFEQIHREFVRSFRARGFRMKEPEFPMVAIVFPDQPAFVKYCNDEQARVQPQVVGVYLTKSNRVAMFERPGHEEVDSTVIHEATHQVAFNTGIHSRLSNHPRWVVEGLATVFEADGVRSQQGTLLADRVNRERYLWFQDYARQRRSAGALKRFLSDDHCFDESIMDAYSEAWALSFFLVETRPIQYAKYLKLLVEHEPLAPSDTAMRLKDFTDAFGTDIDRLEQTYLRFVKRIAER